MYAIIRKQDCPKCGEYATLYCSDSAHTPVCANCLREWYPPFMTLIKFDQGSYQKLWNLEVGDYEDFDKVSDLELCDWIVKSRMELLYRKEPRVKAVVYHMEFHGDVACGRCIHFPFPKDWSECLSQACSKLAKPHRPEHEIQYPPERSKFVQWTKTNR